MAYTSWSVAFGEQPSAAKWNILGTNDAYFDGLIGSGTAWASWTPTLTNLSGGTLNYSKYQQLGKLINIRFKYTLAGAGVAGDVEFTLPVAMHADYADQNNEVINCYVNLRDTGTQSRAGILTRGSTTSKMAIRSLDTGANFVSLSSTVPHVWANTDVIYASGTYEAA